MLCDAGVYNQFFIPLSEKKENSGEGVGRPETGIRKTTDAIPARNQGTNPPTHQSRTAR